MSDLNGLNGLPYNTYQMMINRAMKYGLSFNEAALAVSKIDQLIREKAMKAEMKANETDEDKRIKQLKEDYRTAQDRLVKIAKDDIDKGCTCYQCVTKQEGDDGSFHLFYPNGYT